MPWPAVLALCATLLLAAPSIHAADRPVRVVASFSILADMARAVGAGRVTVTPLVRPDGDAHVYEPSPADAETVATADLVLVNGLGFDGWVERLVGAAGYAGPVAVASAGVTPLGLAAEGSHAHDHGAADPHAWQSLQNGRRYALNIAAALKAADPAGASAYDAKAEAYLREIEALDRELRAAFARLPAERRKIVTSHDSFAYFAAAYGLEIVSPQGFSTESEASAADVGDLIRQIRAEAIPAVFVENVTDPRLIEQISRETDARIGGSLYSDALSAPGGPAPTYLGMFRHNLALLLAALTA